MTARLGYGATIVHNVPEWQDQAATFPHDMPSEMRWEFLDNHLSDG